MTAKTAPTFEYPVEANGSWFEGLLQAAADGAFEPPASVVNWATSYGVTVRAGHAAAAAHVRQFPSNWLNAAVARTAQTLSAGSAVAPITPETIEAGAAQLVAHEDAQRLATLRRDLAERLADRVRDLAGGVLTEAAVMGPLKAAHDEVLAAVRALGSDVPTSDGEALDSPVEMVGKYRQLRDLSARFLAIRAAWDALRANPLERRQCRDGRGLFADSPVGPGFRLTPTTGADIRRPGPDGLARLVWLAGEGRGWLPTISEEDAAVDAWSIQASKGAKGSSKITEEALTS
jgi:hypothetical protein